MGTQLLDTCLGGLLGLFAGALNYRLIFTFRNRLASWALGQMHKPQGLMRLSLGIRSRRNQTYPRSLYAILPINSLFITPWCLATVAWAMTRPKDDPVVFLVICPAWTLILAITFLALCRFVRPVDDESGPSMF
jgi:hypothetical protein